MQAELQAINHQTADRAAYLQLAETLTAFLERLRSNADTLDMGQRQRIMRLLVKEVIVGKDLITIKHSIPRQTAPTGGNPQAQKSPIQHDTAQIDKSYPLCKGREPATSLSVDSEKGALGFSRMPSPVSMTMSSCPVSQ